MSFTKASETIFLTRIWQQVTNKLIMSTLFSDILEVTLKKHRHSLIPNVFTMLVKIIEYVGKD